MRGRSLTKSRIASDPASDGTPATARGNLSIYAVADQMLWRSNTDPNKTLSALLSIAAVFAATASLALADAKPGSPAAEAQADIQKSMGFVPQFFEAIPEVMLPGVWGEMKSLQMNPATALSDGHQALLPLQVSHLMKEMRRVAEAVGRTL